MKKSIIIVIGLVVLFFIITWAVSFFKRPNQMGLLESQTMNMAVQPPTGVMPVQVETVKYIPFIHSISYTGSAIAYNEIPIYPRVEGLLLSLESYPGDKIYEGEIIAQLDSQELSSKVKEANFTALASKKTYNAALKTIDQNRSLLNKSNQAITAAKADLTYWQNEIKRARSLLAEGVISQQEAQSEEAQYEKSLAAYNQTIAEYNATKNALGSAYDQAGAQESQFNQALTNVQTQNIVKGYTTITSPITGLVTERLIPPGTLVTPGMQIIKIAQLKPLRIQANVALSDMNKIKIGDKVLITKTDVSDKSPTSAKVTAIFPYVDLKTRTGIIEAVIPNDNLNFLPGDYISMSISTGKEKKALVVLNTALVGVNEQKAVWTIKDNKANLQFVTTGDTDGKHTEIIAGLKPGDNIITKYNQDLQQDMPVSTVSSDNFNVAKLVNKVANRLDSSNNYTLTRVVGHYSLTMELLKKPPIIGDNPFELNISTEHGSIPSDISIEVNDFMPAMPKMIVPKPNIQKKDSKNFKGKMNYTMPGLWEIDIVIKQGNEVISKIKFETEVPE